MCVYIVTRNCLFKSLWPHRYLNRHWHSYDAFSASLRTSATRASGP